MRNGQIQAKRRMWITNIRLMMPRSVFMLMSVPLMIGSPRVSRLISFPVFWAIIMSDAKLPAYEKGKNEPAVNKSGFTCG